MKYTFLFLLISLVLLGCKKDEIGNAHIEGYIINHATGDPIPNIIVNLWDPDLGDLDPFNRILVASQPSNSLGFFLFDGNYKSYDNDLSLDLGNYFDHYQYPVEVNGVLDSLFYPWGILVEGHSSEPQTFTLELIP